MNIKGAGGIAVIQAKSQFSFYVLASFTIATSLQHQCTRLRSTMSPPSPPDQVVLTHVSPAGGSVEAACETQFSLALQLITKVLRFIHRIFWLKSHL
jgi:hypothetical protein